jgi:proteasome assembly chaperone (PAC2) family protein
VVEKIIGVDDVNEEQHLIFDSRPTLHNPYIVCGLDGWINSGDVATGGINYFIRQFKAKKFAEIPAPRYHIYQIPSIQSMGPVFKMQHGLIVESHLPRNEFYYAENRVSDHDLILFLGTEPNLNWEEYADIVVSLASSFGATRLCALGGLMDRIPYTREPIMTCTCTSPKVKAEMEQYNVMFSNREGPATFNQMLLYACKKKGLDGVGFTVRVPYYPEYNVAIGYSAKSIKAVLIRLNHMLHLDLNFDELNNTAKELQDKLDVVRRQNPEFNTYIEDLEKDYVEMTYEETLDISPSEAVRFAEEFLKENKDQSNG